MTTKYKNVILLRFLVNKNSLEDNNIRLLFSNLDSYTKSK